MHRQTMAQMHWQTKHMERFLGRERRERGEEEREEGREGGNQAEKQLRDLNQKH